MKVAVVGAGLSGLSAAFYLGRYLPACSVKVLEATSKPGGWIQTLHFKNGSVLEVGPKSVRANAASSPYLLCLVEAAGLADEIVAVSKDQASVKRRSVFFKDKLHELPSNFLSLLFRTQPFSRPLIQPIVSNFISRTPLDCQDLDLDAFFRSRFNNEITDLLIDPVVRGIFAGKLKDLSSKSCFPDIWRAERLSGSVVRGLLFPTGPSPSELQLDNFNMDNSSLLQRCLKERWAIWSLRDGLSGICETLSKLFNISYSSPVSNIFLSQGADAGATISYGENHSENFDHVFLAIPSYRVSSMLSNVDAGSEMLLGLRNLRFVDVVVVTLQYNGNIYQKLDLCGFGHLLPSLECPYFLGVVYDSSIFPHHDRGSSSTKLTCMLGGAWFHDISHFDNDQLIQCAMSGIATQLKLYDDPINVHVAVHKSCIPQYPVNHSHIVQKWREEVSSLPVSLLGSSYDGVSVNDCAKSGHDAAYNYFLSKSKL